ncbi:MAG: hypothetical protein ACE5HP_11660 [Gemmatimonadota bacterium]
MIPTLGVSLCALLVAGAAHPAGAHPPGAVDPDGENRAASRPLDIPAFARRYRTSCSTCHTAAPKLNPLGEAFRLNGYRFPENDKLLRRVEPVPLGADPWRELWPRSIWPGELPGHIPLAIRVQNDFQFTRDRREEASSSFRFPEEIYVLAGANLGGNISTFLSTEWNRDEGLQVVQAKVEFQDPVPALPRRLLNLWIGFQNLYLFTFADRQIDRAGRQNFVWQTYRPTELELLDPETGDSLRSTNDFRLRRTQPAVELNGLITPRLYYSFGVSQGSGNRTTDNNDHKDLYYKARYKLGGLRLDGRYDAGGTPVLGGRGQLLDRTLILEHFGYIGAQPVAGERRDTHRSFGFSARGLYGPLDLGVGYVWGRNENPWGDRIDGELPFSSLFAKAEYLVFPWLITSLKMEGFDLDVPPTVRESGLTRGDLDQTRILPGVIILARQNVRAVVEAELFAEHAATAARGQRRPHALWLRLDVAF